MNRQISNHSIDRRHGFARRASAIMFLLTVGAFLSVPNTSADETALDVGGATVKFSPIPGWCVYPPILQNEAMKNFRKVENPVVAHVIFGDCQQIDAALREGTRIRDFGYLGSSKNALTVEMTYNRAEFVALLEKAARETDVDSEAMSMRDKVNNAKLGIEIGEVRLLGVIASDSKALYSALLQRLKLASESFDQISVWGTTLVSRRMLFCYFYTDHKDEAAIDAALSRAQLQVSRLIEMNP